MIRLPQAGIDNVNIFKIERYMQRSKLAQKVCREGALDLMTLT